VDQVRTLNHADNGVGNWPIGYAGFCIIASQCQDFLLGTETACHDNGGDWYTFDQYADCCAWWAANSEPEGFMPQSTHSWAIRSEHHKLILRLGASCPRETSCTLEFYHLPTPIPPNVTGIESDATRIDLPPADPVDAAAFTALRASLRKLIESEPYCLGDANRDRAVDTNDLLGVLGDWGNEQITPGVDPAEGRGSFFDMTQDGIVGVDDLLAVITNWTPSCAGGTPWPPTRDEQAAWGEAWNIPFYNESPMDCLMQDAGP